MRVIEFLDIAICNNLIEFMQTFKLNGWGYRHFVFAECDYDCTRTEIGYQSAGLDGDRITPRAPSGVERISVNIEGSGELLGLSRRHR